MFLKTILAALSVSAIASPILSVNADLAVPLNYTGPSLYRSASDSISITVLATGGTGNAQLAFFVDLQGTFFASPLSDGRASFSASSDQGGGIYQATWLTGWPSFHCGQAGWQGCTLPITFGVPETITMSGSAQAIYSTLGVPANYFVGTVYADLSAQIAGVGVYGPGGFQFLPNALLTEVTDTMPESPSLVLVGLGMACGGLKFSLTQIRGRSIKEIALGMIS